ncbi:hypothetical protein GCM10010176_067360 [Nonomuraea spiralis]|nr:hypothetical protein GCM10010176_067360 [Nonomuraea spiralis]
MHAACSKEGEAGARMPLAFMVVTTGLAVGSALGIVAVRLRAAGGRDGVRPDGRLYGSGSDERLSHMDGRHVIGSLGHRSVRDRRTGSPCGEECVGRREGDVTAVLPTRRK